MKIKLILDSIRLVIFLFILSGFTYILILDPIQYESTQKNSTCFNKSFTINNYKKIVRRNMQRISKLKKNCEELGLNKGDIMTVNPKYLEYLLIDQKHKLMYCYVPKIATRSWLALWLKLLGVEKYDGIIHKQSFLLRFSNLTYEQQNEVLMDYTKFMIARNPFERFVSAYKDKFGSPEFMIQPFENISEYILDKKFKLRPLKPVNVDENTDVMDFVKFHQFVQYIITTEISQVPKFNEHWDLMNNLCNPCRIHYDVIAHYETIEEDSNFVLDLINFSDDRFPKSNATSSRGKKLMEHYFSTIPEDAIQQLYHIMEKDFLLFDFDPSNILKIHKKLKTNFKL